MKNLLILIFCTFASFYSQAREINLVCKGKVAYQGENPEVKVYEVSFDDRRKDVLSMTIALSKGCTLQENDEYAIAKKCECKVNANEISCNSMATSKNFESHIFNDSFSINRKTGRMTTNYSFTGKDMYGVEFGYFRNGELMCEILKANKF